MKAVRIGLPGLPGTRKTGSKRCASIIIASEYQKADT
jgi:hypothetical protein